jgi:EAL domain-containing protein (putative c-di-GMP-specific phosphodiesterase class I)
MDEKTRKNIHMMNSLRNAVSNNELILYFQPIIHIKTNEVHAAEALLRWQYDDKGFVPLSDLIPVAEESGLISDIGKWVISTACKQMRIWQENSSCNLKYITINISSKQLRDPHFSSFLLQSIKSYHLQPSSIKLEVTESALIENFDETKLLIEKLNYEGIEFIIDDFGTGYSSLSYLKTLPFSTLKIDRSFIRDVLTDPDDATLIRAIMDIAHQFEYQIVAEGVEEEAQRRKLMEMNDSILYQGFLTCKPCSVSDFEEFISEWQQNESVTDETLRY